MANERRFAKRDLFTAAALAKSSAKKIDQAVKALGDDAPADLTVLLNAARGLSTRLEIHAGRVRA